MKRITLLSVIFFLLASAANGQDTARRYRVIIFAPLYLDSAFDAAQQYRYTKDVFPKFINPGLEFYEGAQFALDSLNKMGAELEVHILDTRSASTSLQQQLDKPEVQTADLVIAHCSSNEVRSLSLFALQKNVPVINATVPNDAGTNGNPYFIILNPTLRTQCEGIYKFLQKNYAVNPIVVFRRKGQADDLVKGLLDDYAKLSVSTPLKLKYVELVDSFTVNQLKAQLDTTRKTICVSGSLDVNFGKRLALHLAKLNQQHPLALVGMPTWDAIARDFSRPEYKGLEIIYSTPFYHSRMDKVSESIVNYFAETMYARPSDMVFRGYETTWKFAQLLLQHKQDFPSNFSSKSFQLFTDFDIQPVLDRQTMTLDYFENKKLYFLKWQDGTMKIMP
ncbi:MAG TPA: ABC transporter substrate-binding protein [Chitinophagaceae bacterium]|nr:ABC transporter substrate-binding protein [Chitinophagaceae bacterium]